MASFPSYAFGSPDAGSAARPETFNTVLALVNGSPAIQAVRINLLHSARWTTLRLISPVLLQLLAANVTFFAPVDSAFPKLAELLEQADWLDSNLDINDGAFAEPLLRHHIFDPYANFTPFIESKMGAATSNGLTTVRVFSLPPFQGDTSSKHSFFFSKLPAQVVALDWQNNSAAAGGPRLRFLSPNVLQFQVYEEETIKTKTGILVPIYDVMMPAFCANRTMFYDSSVYFTFQSALEKTGVMEELEALPEVTVLV